VPLGAAASLITVAAHAAGIARAVTNDNEARFFMFLSLISLSLQKKIINYDIADLLFPLNQKITGIDEMAYLIHLPRIAMSGSRLILILVSVPRKSN
jgi:hypothetical protein